MAGTLRVTVTGKSTCTSCQVTITPTGGGAQNYTCTKTPPATQWTLVKTLTAGDYTVYSTCLSVPTPPCVTSSVPASITDNHLTSISLTQPCV